MVAPGVTLRSVEDVDLTAQATSRVLLDADHPEAVIIATAEVGGFLVNVEQPQGFISVRHAIGLDFIGEPLRLS